MNSQATQTAGFGQSAGLGIYSTMAANSERALQSKSQQISTTDAMTLQQIEKVAKEFEGMVMGFFIRTMFEGVEVDEEFGGGYAEEVFRDMMLDEMGNVMSKNGGIGIADQVQKQLLQLQQI